MEKPLISVALSEPAGLRGIWLIALSSISQVSQMSKREVSLKCWIKTQSYLNTRT